MVAGHDSIANLRPVPWIEDDARHLLCMMEEAMDNLPRTVAVHLYFITIAYKQPPRSREERGREGRREGRRGEGEGGHFLLLVYEMVSSASHWTSETGPSVNTTDQYYNPLLWTSGRHT